MRGARGVNTRSAGPVSLDAGGMYHFALSCAELRFHAHAALQSCVRLCLSRVFVSWCACLAVSGAYPSVQEGGFPRELVVSHA